MVAALGVLFGRQQHPPPVTLAQDPVLGQDGLGVAIVGAGDHAAVLVADVVPQVRLDADDHPVVGVILPVDQPQVLDLGFGEELGDVVPTLPVEVVEAQHPLGVQVRSQKRPQVSPVAGRPGVDDVPVQRRRRGLDHLGGEGLVVHARLFGRDLDLPLPLLAGLPPGPHTADTAPRRAGDRLPRIPPADAHLEHLHQIQPTDAHEDDEHEHAADGTAAAAEPASAAAEPSASAAAEAATPAAAPAPEVGAAAARGSENTPGLDEGKEESRAEHRGTPSLFHKTSLLSEALIRTSGPVAEPIWRPAPLWNHRVG